jgi:Uma2 family endonuclease
LLAIAERERNHEIIDGKLVQRATYWAPHAKVQIELGTDINGTYGPRSRGRGPGGWLFMTEAEIIFAPLQVYRPDLAGWRRERMPRMPEEYPISVRPDWVCEILSPSNKQDDLFTKLRTYQRSQVGHYWIIDPELESLCVYRWTSEGYLLVATAQSDECIRAEPFEAIEISVRDLLSMGE